MQSASARNWRSRDHTVFIKDVTLKARGDMPEKKFADFGQLQPRPIVKGDGLRRQINAVHDRVRLKMKSTPSPCHELPSQLQ